MAERVPDGNRTAAERSGETDGAGSADLHLHRQEARDAYVRRSLDDLFGTWLVRGDCLGAFLFLSLSVLDYFVAGEHFFLFLKYRAAVAVFLLLTAITARSVRHKGTLSLMAYASVFASAIAIEAMILQFGGHASIYYPGMILLGVAVFSIFPASVIFHVFCGAGMYLIYLLPILVLDGITDAPFFITANVFMISIFATAILLRYLYHRSMSRQFSLQFDMEHHREHLEKVVDTRTMTLRGVVEDLRNEISSHRRTESQLVDVLADWRTTFDSAREMIFSLDEKMAVRKLNRAASEYFGCSLGESLGRSFYDILGPCTIEKGEYPLERMMKTGVHEEAEIFLPARDDWLMVSADPILDRYGTCVGAVHMLHNINDLRRMREQILQGKAEWEETFDVINDAITIHDSRFRIVRANRAAVDLLGESMQEILSRPCYELYHGDSSPPAECPSCEVLRDGAPCTSEIFEPHLGRHLEIKALPRLDEEGKVTGLVHVVRDITARKEAEDRHSQLQSQLQQSQKMESIGRLAGGVAHDFNNILFAMLGYSELAMQKLEKDNPVQNHLRIISESGERAAALNRQLLAFSRKQVLDIQPVKLQEIIENMVKMLERLIGEDLRLSIEIPDPVRMIMADPGQIEQIVLNLVVNSRDALQAGGEIVIRAGDLDLQREFRGSHGSGGPGRFVEISVTDNGCGMTEAVGEQVFEPFFTTKKVGEGSGLGLSTVYGIVQQHGGFIDLSSCPGEGTKIRIVLPVKGEGKALETVHAIGNAAGGSETILIVEDEGNVRNLMRDVLEPLGYNLLEAVDGEEARRLVGDSEEKIDLLLTDVVMPKMNGWEFAKIFRGHYPEARVVFVSGYTHDIISQHGVLDSEEVLLQKPVKPAILAKVVREVLDGHCRLPAM